MEEIEKTGTMFGGETLDDNLWFGGLYQVVRVDSRMESGQFTQMLTCVRMNNQQGFKSELAQAVAKNSREINDSVAKKFKDSWKWEKRMKKYEKETNDIIAKRKILGQKELDIGLIKID